MSAKRCNGKLRFTTQEHALNAAITYSTRGPQRAYFHDKCGGWHLTSKRAFDDPETVVGHTTQEKR